MEFACDAKQLGSALRMLWSAFPHRGRHPACAAGAFRIRGSKLEIVSATTGTAQVTFSVTLDCAADCDGRVFIALAPLPILLPRKGTVTIQCHPTRIILKERGIRFTFPDVSYTLAGQYEDIETPYNVSHDGISRCLPFIAREDARFGSPISGLLIHADGKGKVNYVGTDGRILKKVVEERDIDDRFSVVIPRQAAAVIARKFPQGDMRFGFQQDRGAVFKSGNLKLTTYLIEEVYPNYQGLLDAARRDYAVEVEKTTLQELLRSVMAVYPPRVRKSVDMVAEEGRITLSASSHLGSTCGSVEAKTTGTITRRLNGMYLYVVLNSIKSDNITIHTGPAVASEGEATSTPGMLTFSGDQNEAAALMPMTM